MSASTGAADPEVVASLARIEGRVQGVGYRHWTEGQATALGLSGYVRNLTDGSVEALFMGPPQAVARMLTYCEDGPPGAAVERVTSRRPEPELARRAETRLVGRFRRFATRAPGEPVDIG